MISILKQIRRYRKLYRKYGFHHLSLSWASTASQQKRFQVFAQQLKSQGSSLSVLDLGCGFGDFYRYLIQAQYKIDYTGVDIMKEFIQEAQKRYPQAQWKLKDALAYLDSDKKYDYIFGSGLFAFSNRKKFEKIILKAIDSMNEAFIFNIHETNHADFFSPSFEDIKKIIEKENNMRIKKIDNYLSDDYTVILMKIPSSRT